MGTIIHKLYKIRYLLFLGWLLVFVAPLFMGYVAQGEIVSYNQYLERKAEIEKLSPIYKVGEGEIAERKAPSLTIIAIYHFAFNPASRLVGVYVGVMLSIIFLVLYPYSVGYRRNSYGASVVPNEDGI